MKCCSSCDSKKELTERTIEKYRYKESGLSNVILHGVREFVCPDCGEVVVNFGNLRTLHDAIARIVIRKSKMLNGEELRFLRKYLGFSTTVFAKLVGYAPETISRYENDKVEAPIPYDRFVRMWVANKLQDRDYDLHTLFLDGKGINLKWVELIKRDGQWEPAKAA